jgi:lipopolysaccharide transport system permease protein
MTPINPPAPEARLIVIRRTQGWRALQLQDVWEFRDLLYFMVWRDIKVRYKQTALGVAWIVLQPLVSTLIFSSLFGLLLKVPSGDVPYPVFALSGLLPWNYFSGALTRASGSLIQNANLINKVYFPRVLMPMSSVVSGLVDVGVVFGALLAVMLLYGFSLRWEMIFLPFFILLAVVTALGFGMWLAALNVRYRDVGFLIPFITQIWLYLTPVIYPTTLIPAALRPLLALNPMTAVVEGFRWALLGDRLQGALPSAELLAVSTLVAIAVLVSGMFFFRRTERTFADIV